ncbi:MAG: peptidylprolyl isomerase [Acidobacteriota bacterium]|nr:peptidylprolyl isomerase [Acidobacteriota bacterium]
MLKNLLLFTFYFVVFYPAIVAQEVSPETKVKSATSGNSKKSNQRPVIKASKTTIESVPFEKASVETMGMQCVKFETEAGVIELEMFPESAPEAVRNFLNLSAAGSYNTTTFSRVVPGFIVQGGDLATREKITPELDKRSRRTIPDEPSLIKHERGILSMARSDAPNSATTNFFILVGQARHLDGTFAAFGRVTRGMEVVDAINKMPIEGDKPKKPARLTRATVARCPVQTAP